MAKILLLNNYKFYAYYPLSVKKLSNTEIIYYNSISLSLSQSARRAIFCGSVIAFSGCSFLV